MPKLKNQDFAVYWKICKNLSSWNLNYFLIYGNIYIHSFCCVRYVARHWFRKRTILLFDSVNWGWYWLIDFRLDNNAATTETVHENNHKKTTIKKTATIKIKSTQNLLKFHDLQKFNDAKFSKICIYQNEFTWKLI